MLNWYCIPVRPGKSISARYLSLLYIFFKKRQLYITCVDFFGGSCLNYNIFRMHGSSPFPERLIFCVNGYSSDSQNPRRMARILTVTYIQFPVRTGHFDKYCMTIQSDHFPHHRQLSAPSTPENLLLHPANHILLLLPLSLLRYLLPAQCQSYRVPLYYHRESDSHNLPEIIFRLLCLINKTPVLQLLINYSSNTEVQCGHLVALILISLWQ